ncbi:hypothetical protein MAR_003775 [Mya arenaria]|uniref:Uncharacterized protein n=1 Tax=Mya arenaria TaxID=6604 RepID=A0ABY7GA62_MYAAR|nr:hypothetical protein MAR_003775 [Mya arenaria]
MSKSPKHYAEVAFQIGMHGGVFRPFPHVYMSSYVECFAHLIYLGFPCYWFINLVLQDKTTYQTNLICLAIFFWKNNFASVCVYFVRKQVTVKTFPFVAVERYTLLL